MPGYTKLLSKLPESSDDSNKVLIDIISKLVDDILILKKEVSSLKSKLRKQTKVVKEPEIKLNYFIDGTGATYDHIGMDELINYFTFKKTAILYLIIDHYFSKKCPENNIIKITDESTVLVYEFIDSESVWSEYNLNKLVEILITTEIKFLIDKLHNTDLSKILSLQVDSVEKYFNELDIDELNNTISNELINRFLIKSQSQ